MALKLPDNYGPRRIPGASGAVLRSDSTAAARARGEAIASEGRVNVDLKVQEKQTRTGIIRQERNLAQENLRKDAEVDILGIRQFAAASQRRAAAEGSLGDAFMDVGDYIAEQGRVLQEKNDRAAYASAESEFLKRKVLLEAQLEEEGDYSQERYVEELTKIRDEVGKGISNPDHLRNYVIGTELPIAKGRVAWNDKAIRQQSDVERAALNQSAADTILAISKEQDEFQRMALVEKFSRQVDNAYNNQAISAQERVATIGSFQEKYANTILINKTPEEQIRAIQSEAEGDKWTDYLSPSTRARALAAANDAIETNAILTTVDDMMARYNRDELTFEAGMAEISQLKGDTRLKAERRWQDMTTLSDKASAAKQSADFLQYHMTLSNPATTETFDDLPLSVRSQFTLQQQNALRTVSSQRIKGTVRKHSDINATMQLWDMEAKRDYDGILKWLGNEENAGKLTYADTAKFAELAIKKDTSFEVKSLFTAQQQITKQAKAINLSDSKTAILTERVGQWYESYQVRNQKVPTDAEVSSAIDGFFLEFDTPGLGGDEYVFEDESLDPVLMDRLADAFKKLRGRLPSENELTELYQDLLKEQGRE